MTVKIVFVFALVCFLLVGCQKKMSQQEASKFLTKNGFIVSSEENFSLEGIQKRTLQGLLALKRQCKKCLSLSISGGTETGHASIDHMEGLAVDISGYGSMDNLGTFLAKKIGESTPLVYDTKYHMSAYGYQYIFIKENNRGHWNSWHWHITIR
jgi:hypothetical protein